MQLFRDYINYYVSLPKETMAAFEDAFDIRTYSKGEVIFKEGAVCSNLYFILNGICRTFHHHDQKELTTWIYPEGYFITAWASFITQKTSAESIQVLEDSEIASITIDSLNKLYDQHPLIERFSRKLAEEQLALLDDYSRGYHLKSAKEKYEALLDFFPDITQRVNLGYIASMLGISQETLSRIRKGD